MVLSAAEEAGDSCFSTAERVEARQNLTRRRKVWRCGSTTAASCALSGAYRRAASAWLSHGSRLPR